MYLIRVHDDGDTEIRQLEDDQPYVEDDAIRFYSVEEVAFELRDYGHDENRINEALDRVSSETDWVEV